MLWGSAQAGSYDDFFKAVGQNDVVAVQHLLARGFDPNAVDEHGNTALLNALRESSFDVAQALVLAPTLKVEQRNPHDESPLMLAALRGHLGLCRDLIARDADVNKTGWTPLHYAASGGHVAVIGLLLDAHAYIDAESPNGTTPLMMAAQYGNPESVQALIDAGADVTLRNQLGLTALDFAQRGANADSLKHLQQAGRPHRGESGW